MKQTLLRLQYPMHCYLIQQQYNGEITNGLAFEIMVPYQSINAYYSKVFLVLKIQSVCFEVKNVFTYVLNLGHLFKVYTEFTYRKVMSSRLSRLVAYSRIFRLFMKGKFNAYVL